jgi:phosphate transport system substrate-binding protein
MDGSTRRGRMRIHVRTAIVGGLAAFALVAAACGSDSSTSSPGTGGDVSGSLNISGSSTVEPITSLVAENFQGMNSGVDIAVDGPGTTDGFELFCKGQTDINDASRQISDDEKAACSDEGVHYVELAIGRDALTVVGNPSNPLTCLSLADLYSLFSSEAQNFKNWSDANALDMELKGKGDFPDLPLTIVAPGTESGTYGSFIDLAIKGIADERGKPDDTLRTDYQSSADDNVIITNAEGTEGALGFVGFAYAQNAAGQVKEFEIDGGDGCVAPSADTVNDGTYALGRTLYVYVNTDKLATNDALQPFVDYYLSDEGIAAVTQVQYIALPTDELQSSRDTWQQTESGSSPSA